VNSELSLEVSDSSNPKVMRLFDTSHYCGDEKIENYLIEVLAPSKSAWVTFNVAKNFSLVLNSSNLRYRKVSDEADLAPLPDGVYEITQSFKPNGYTIVRFFHLRIVDLKRRIAVEWKKLVDNVCKLSHEEFFDNRDKLREIQEYAYAAKWEVEECNDKKKGKEIYEFAKKLLEQYTRKCGC
jgi:hypothetical protein